MTAFFDTSALAKHYHAEPATPAVDRLLAAAAGRCHVSRLARIEMLSVFGKKVRTGQLTTTAVRLLAARFRADLRDGRYTVARLTAPRLDLAERLVVRLAPAHNLRSLDAIQLAVAMTLNRSVGPVTFISADQALCRIAAAEGLTVNNPEQP